MKDWAKALGERSSALLNSFQDGLSRALLDIVRDMYKSLSLQKVLEHIRSNTPLYVLACTDIPIAAVAGPYTPIGNDMPGMRPGDVIEFTIEFDLTENTCLITHAEFMAAPDVE